MARPNGRRSVVKPSSKTTTPAKRAAPSTTSTPVRSSKRVKTASATPTSATKAQSIYVAPDIGESEAESEIEDEDASVVSSPPSSEPASSDDEATEYTSEEEAPRKRKRKPASAKKVAISKAEAEKFISTNPYSDRWDKDRVGKCQDTPTAKGKELWREGAKVDAAFGEEVFIKLPKARGPGKTPYTPSAIHPNTLLFLADLAANNDRAWLKVHDADFRQAENDWKSFVDALTERIIDSVDDTIPELPCKDLMFRIYRDVRFSKDPTPYKAHFSAAWSRTGRKGPYACYYFQIKPNGGSFVGGGLWMPEADAVALIRDQIHRRPGKLKAVLMDAAVRKEFLKGAKADEKECTKRFCEMNKEAALKTKPKGYDADHRDIALLRLKNFALRRQLRDEEVLGKKGFERVAELMRCMKPWVSFFGAPPLLFFFGKAQGVFLTVWVDMVFE
jgi:uncharacterized protein (TIGR02453 family)